MRRFSALVLGLALLPGLALQPGQGRAADKEEDEDGWITLFTGKDRTGWRANENGKFSVADGAIVVEGERAHLFSEQEFKDFHFKAEVKTKPGSNSGIFFHTEYQDEGWPEKGYEAQVNNTYKSDPVRTGSLYYYVKLNETKARDDEWFTEEIIVRGDHIVIRVNGETVVDFREDPAKIMGEHKLGKGVFALQAHDPGSKVYYRNIKVKPLAEE